MSNNHTRQPNENTSWKMLVWVDPLLLELELVQAFRPSYYSDRVWDDLKLTWLLFSLCLAGFGWVNWVKQVIIRLIGLCWYKKLHVPYNKLTDWIWVNFGLDLNPTYYMITWIGTPLSLIIFGWYILCSILMISKVL